MSASANLGLPYLAAGQAQKHVTVNESLLRLDAIVQLAVVSATTSAEPGAPTDGEAYILPASKSGANWGAMSNGALAYYRDGAWEEITPREGFLAFVNDADQLLYFTGAAWNLFPAEKILTVSATDRVLGRVSSGAGPVEEVAFTDQAQALCDDASFSAMRATLGAAGLADNNALTGTLSIDNSNSAVLTVRRTADNAGSCIVQFDRNRATPAAADGLFIFRSSGRNSAAATVNYADLRTTLLDPSAGSEDASWDVYTMAAGAQAARLSIHQGLAMAGATGGDKGAGTINATAVYDDNVLLTCGPLEFARNGALDLEKWDALVPDRMHAAVLEDIVEEHARDVDEAFEIIDDEGRARLVQRRRRIVEQRVVGQRVVREAFVEQRRHEVMHAFAAMLAEGFDPRDADNFCARMRADGAVPGLMTETEWRAMQARGDKPDSGAMLTRTVLALDNLAVAFASAVERIGNLEQRLDAARS